MESKTNSNNDSLSQKVIYFAGGCFWGTEHFFKLINGVSSTEVGYANGHTTNPTYKQVIKDDTGFAETVKVTYDPNQIELSLLLELFFKAMILGLNTAQVFITLWTDSFL